MNGLVLIGGGGHCKSAIDVIEQDGSHNIIGILDKQSCRSTELMGYSILGTDDRLSSLIEDGIRVMITIGQIKTAELRERVFLRAKRVGAKFPVIISPQAYCSRHTDVGVGTMVMHGAVINAGARIGENCIVNSLALLEHDVSVGAHTHIATGARVNGGVKIGPRTFIGSGAIIHNDIEIAEGCIVGAGEVVRENLAPGSIKKTPQQSYRRD